VIGFAEIVVPMSASTNPDPPEPVPTPPDLVIHWRASSLSADEKGSTVSSNSIATRASLVASTRSGVFHHFSSASIDAIRCCSTRRSNSILRTSHTSSQRS